jgi:hypothetical protein
MIWKFSCAYEGRTIARIESSHDANDTRYNDWFRIVFADGEALLIENEGDTNACGMDAHWQAKPK